jgi:hypothetical protein
MLGEFWIAKGYYLIAASVNFVEAFARFEKIPK